MAALIGERNWWNALEILRRDHCSLVAVASSTRGTGTVIGAGTGMGMGAGTGTGIGIGIGTVLGGIRRWY